MIIHSIFIQKVRSFNDSLFLMSHKSSAVAGVFPRPRLAGGGGEGTAEQTEVAKRMSRQMKALDKRLTC